VSPELRNPRQQLADHFRQKIMSGELSEGDQLPTTREITEVWGFSSATIVKALGLLRAEGLIQTTPAGTFVSASQHLTYAPRDRFLAAEQTGRIYPLSDESRIISVELVSAPAAVVEALCVDDGAEVIRRERVTFHGRQPVTWSVSWLPGALAEAVPELLGTERIPGGTTGRIAEETGRHLRYGRDQLQARPATAVEADALGLQEGDAVLAGANTWCDEGGEAVEFGEFVIPPRRRIAYDYRMPAD
jgi:GntR family transcriptional regulator